MNIIKTTYKYSGSHFAINTCIDYLSFLCRSMVVFFVLTHSFPLLSQVVSIEGIIHTNKTPIERASITIRSGQGDRLISYTYTNTQGRFKLDLDRNLGEVLISVRHIGYKPHKQHVTLKTAQNLEINLQEDVSAIKEVVVRAPSVWKRQDTISYNVKKISRLGDRSIGDVIRHIPGIRIQGDKIEYQGKALKQINIDGVDLSQGDYSLLTRNIDASDVATIQILDNHQSVKALAGKQSSDDVIVNLKLSPKKRGVWGNAVDIGLGYGEQVETNSRLRSSYFTQKSQWLGLLYADNTGRLNYENTNTNSLLREEPPIFASVEPVNAPAMPSSYYLDNISLLTRGNAALINKDSSQLYLYGSYRYDRIQSEGKTDTEYIGEGETIKLKESIQRYLKKHEILAGLTYEKNLQHYYLRNRFQVGLIKQPIYGSVTLNEELYPQSSSLDIFRLNNQLRYIHTKRRRPIEIVMSQQLHSSNESVIIQNNRQIETMQPLTHRNTIQTIQLGEDLSLVSDNYLQIPSIQLVRSIKYRPKLNISYQYQELGHSLFSEQYSVNEQVFRVGIEQAITYISRQQEVELSFPLSYYGRWTNHAKLTGLVFEPRLKAKLHLNDSWGVDILARYTNKEPSISMRYPYGVLRGYRMITNGTPLLYREKMALFGGTLNYRNVFAFFTTSLRLNQSFSWKPYIQMLHIGERGGQLQLLPHEHRTYTTSALLSSSKGFSFWGLGLDLDVGYTLHSGIEAYQDKISDYSYHTTSLRFGIKASPTRRILFDHSVYYNQNVMKRVNENNDYKSKQILQTVKLGYTLSKQLFWDIIGEYGYLKDRGGETQFLLLSSELSWNHRQVKFSCQLNNIMNLQDHESIRRLSYAIIHQTHRIRPRSILFKASFNL